jgi:mono/diheme cytochrome c family protein
MSPFLLRVFIVLVIATATGVAFQGPAPSSPWPPPLQPAPETASAPVLSPADEMKTFFLPPGYRVELVASEPLISDPVVIDFDAAGRMWLIEMPGYMSDVRASDELEPTGRIVVLEDVNRDGRMDKRTVFAEGLVLPRALKVLDKGILVAEPPSLWYMTDTDGDLRMDQKQEVAQFGRREANVEHNANSLTWALDNWLHTSETDVFFRWKQGKMETKPTLSRGQWGNSQDDAGRIYRNSNSAVLYVDTVATPYYARHPNLIRTRGSYESLLGENGEVNIVWPVRPTPGVNRGYQSGVLRADKTLATYTAVHSPLVYRGDRLPGDVYGNVFVAEPSGNVVSRIILSDSGTTITARKAYENSEFLASTDERFRPVFLSNAPDGTLYVVDMYRGIIQHRGYITEYLYEQIKMRSLELPTRHGRIFRIVHDTTVRDTQTSLAAASTSQVVAALAHANGWWRDTAQRLLVERRDTTAVPALKTLVTDAPQARTRLQALWTLDGMDAADPDVVTRALADRDRDVRAGAIRVSERYLATNQAVRDAVLARVTDTDWAVRQQLAASVGAMADSARVDAAVRVLEQHGTDPVVMDSLLSGLSGVETQVLARLLEGAETPARVQAVTMLAATALRRNDPAAAAAVLADAADTRRPAWQQAALMAGAEVAVLNMTPPGTRAAARGRGAAPAAEEPCPTCPGGRGGPGGARAIPDPPSVAAAGGRAAGGPAGAGTAAQGGGRAGGRGGRGGGPALRLTDAPAALVARANGTDDIAKRATAVLARVEWPGKAGVVAVRPLTAAETTRFEAGRQIYTNLCVACHQPTGVGGDKLAPPLVNSPMLEGGVGRAVRILVHGKEGPVGLMPPLGQVFNDEQIAQVLTFVRRSWGNTYDPVEPAMVQQIRSGLPSRTRPWTTEELTALPAAER